MLQVVASLTNCHSDESRGIIYDRNMFTVQATDSFATAIKGFILQALSVKTVSDLANY
jgi:hypothetical protein